MQRGDGRLPLHFVSGTYGVNIASLALKTYFLGRNIGLYRLPAFHEPRAEVSSGKVQLPPPLEVRNGLAVHEVVECGLGNM